MAVTSDLRNMSTLKVFRYVQNIRTFIALGQQKKSKVISCPAQRLYLELYARFKDPQTYHYALLISPKEESVDPNIREATKFHCKNILQSGVDAVTMPWVYEATQVNPNNDNRILVRILLGKISRVDLAEQMFAEVQVIQNDLNFTCKTWVQKALLRLYQDTIVRSRVTFDWDMIQKTALEYVDKKKQQGRFETGWEGDSSRVPTFDLIMGREIVP